ncbi:DUF5710 domain-containing protein [Streptomyces anthocyanicus]|uniref:DUF5710 domain-containing protein n=2 Tax=Streptomyces TaxID=1883 RepID=UPI00364DA472
MHAKVLILDGSVLWARLEEPAREHRADRPDDALRRPGLLRPLTWLMGRTRMERPARGPWRPTRETAPASEMPAPELRPRTARCTGLVRDGRLYLDVPYEQKDEAKRLLRAQWDRAAWHWWVDADRITREQAARWLPQGKLTASCEGRPPPDASGRTLRHACEAGTGTPCGSALSSLDYSKQRR